MQLTADATKEDKRSRQLATEYAKKVFVNVYADGPTRVLCFSDDKSAILANVEDENSVPNLMHR